MMLMVMTMMKILVEFFFHDEFIKKNANAKKFISSSLSF